LPSGKSLPQRLQDALVNIKFALSRDLLAIKAIVVPFLIKSLNTRAGDRLLALGTVVVRRVRVCFGLRDMVLALIANWFAGIVCVVLITGSNATRAFFTVQCRIVV
jgi:hypothetical protein